MARLRPAALIALDAVCVPIFAAPFVWTLVEIVRLAIELPVSLALNVPTIAATAWLLWRSSR